MVRSRAVVFTALVVVVAGVFAALGALYLDPARAAVGPLPAEGLALPADARFVIGLDVRRFVASPFYEKYATRAGGSRPDAFRDLEEKTGLDPARDVDQVLIAGGAGGRNARGVVMVMGRFDPLKIGQSIEADKKKQVTWKNHLGTTLYMFDEGAKRAGALAFVDDHTLVIGSQEAVEATLANKLQGGPSLKANTALMDLLGKVKPGSTFWMVGDQSLLENMPRGFPGAAGGSSDQSQGLTLPALKGLMVTGDLDPEMSVAIVGEAADAVAAKNLADMVRGLLALASLQSRQKPELQELASAVSITTDASRVLVNARFPYELLDALKPKQAATTVK